MVEDGPCRRCMKAGRRCVVTARTRTGERQKKTDTRVAELEKKIDALTATLQARAGPDQQQQQQTPMYGGVGSTSGSSHGVGTAVGQNASRPAHVSLSAVSETATMRTRSRDWGAVLGMSENTGPAGVDTYQPYAAAAGQKRKIEDILGQGIQNSPQKKSPAAKNASLGADYVDIVERGIITLDIADELFARYNDEMILHLPGVVFPPSMKANDLRQEKPLLFLAVMAAAAAARASLQRTLVKELMEIFGQKVICNGEKSLEIVQALLVSVMWYFPPESFEELKFYQLAHIASVMALDLGLGRSNMTKRKNTSQQQQQQQQQSMHTLGFYTFRPGKDDPESLECRRTWLTCYYLSSNTAMGLRRPFLLRWSSFMEESVRLLETSPEAAPTDKYLCYLLRGNKLGEDVAMRFSLDDPGLTSTLEDFGTQLALRGFEVELERLRRAIPKELMRRTLCKMLSTSPLLARR